MTQILTAVVLLYFVRNSLKICLLLVKGVCPFRLGGVSNFHRKIFIYSDYLEESVGASAFVPLLFNDVKPSNLI